MEPAVHALSLRVVYVRYTAPVALYLADQRRYRTGYRSAMQLQLHHALCAPLSSLQDAIQGCGAASLNCGGRRGAFLSRDRQAASLSGRAARPDGWGAPAGTYARAHSCDGDTGRQPGRDSQADRGAPRCHAVPTAHGELAGHRSLLVHTLTSTYVLRKPPLRDGTALSVNLHAYVRTEFILDVQYLRPEFI
jgi:hypothetical protein